MLLTIIGLLSATVFLIGDYAYFRDTLLGKTAPQRVTWGVAFLLNSIGFANQYASGASNSLWLFGASVLATAAIFGASLSKGVGGYSKLDIFAIVTAFIGVGLWVVFESPVLSIISTLVVVLVSMVPTIAKAKKHPQSETRVTWLLGAISTLMATVSVGELNWTLLILPVNATIIQSYMSYLLYIRAKRQRETATTPAHGPADPIEL